MAGVSFPPGAIYSKEGRDRLMADHGRLKILFEDNPIDADPIMTPRDLASDFQLAAATCFSTFCAERLAATISEKNTPTLSKPTLTIVGPRREFEYYQAAFGFVFDFFCQGTATLDGGEMPFTFLHSIEPLADKLGVDILKAIVSTGREELAQCLPHVKDAKKLLEIFPPGHAAREDLAKALSFHLTKGTLPLSSKALLDLYRDHRDFSEVMIRDRIHRAEAYKGVKPLSTEQQARDLEHRGWRAYLTGKVILKGSNKQGKGNNQNQGKQESEGKKQNKNVAVIVID